MVFPSLSLDSFVVTFPFEVLQVPSDILPDSANPVQLLISVEMDNNNNVNEEQPYDGLANSDNEEDSGKCVYTFIRVPSDLSSRCQRVYGWNATVAERAIVGYKQFMILKRRQLLENDDDKGEFESPCITTPILPPPVIHCVWQQHLLYTRHYGKFCRDFCREGLFISDRCTDATTGCTQQSSSMIIIEHNPEDDDPLLVREQKEQNSQYIGNATGNGRSRESLLDGEPSNARIVQRDDIEHDWESRIKATQEMWKETFQPAKPVDLSSRVWSFELSSDCSLLNKKVGLLGAAPADDTNNDESNNNDDDADESDRPRKRGRRAQVSRERGTEPLTIIARRYRQRENNEINRNNSNRLYTETYFRILPTTKLGKLFKTYDDMLWRENEVDPQTTYLFGDRIVKPTDTAYDLGMTEMDALIVSQSALIDGM